MLRSLRQHGGSPDDTWMWPPGRVAAPPGGNKSKRTLDFPRIGFVGLGSCTRTEWAALPDPQPVPEDAIYSLTHSVPGRTHGLASIGLINARDGASGWTRTRPGVSDPTSTAPRTERRRRRSARKSAIRENLVRWSRDAAAFGRACDTVMSERLTGVARGSQSRQPLGHRA